MTTFPARLKVNLTSRWRDSLAAAVIFLLGIPLSVGAALASGAPAQSGLIAAAAGGLVCGGLLGAPMMVTGPVVALAILALQVISHYGFAAMCLVTVLAGLVQVLLGVARLGRLALAVNTAILEGMLASVGVTLVLSQSQVILAGHPQNSAWANVATLPQSLAQAHWGNVAVAIATLALVAVWNRLPWRRFVPGVLVAITLVTLALTWFAVPDVVRVNLPLHSTWTWLSAADARAAITHHTGPLLYAALELGLICSIYSLLSAVAVDSLHSGARTNLDRELAVQGAANIASGMLGGLPVSGAVLRSTANINAGATSRWSIMLQGIMMLVALTQFGFILRQIPIACLAAFFVLLGCSLLRWQRVVLFYRKGTLPLYAAALLGGVFANLLVGVLCGIGVNLLMLCAQVLKLRITIQTEQHTWLVQLEGVASFLGVATLTRALATIPPQHEVRIVNRATYTDTTISAAIARYQDAYAQLGGKVTLAEAQK